MSTATDAIAAAYAYVRSVEANKAIASLTLDDFIQAQINLLKQGVQTAIVDSRGNQTGVRLSRYDQLTLLQQNLDAAVAAITNAGSDPDKQAAVGVNDTDSVDQ